MIEPLIEEMYADNGAFSHYKVIDKNTGETLWENTEDKSVLSFREWIRETEKENIKISYGDKGLIRLGLTWDQYEIYCKHEGYQPFGTKPTTKVTPIASDCKFKIGKNTTKYYWLDTYLKEIQEIDSNVVNSNGENHPPIDCIKIKQGTVVKLYKSKSRETEHLCVGGWAIGEDAIYGLHSGSDFDSDNYEFIRNIPTDKVVSK